ncbi:MAG: hypothetical protein KDK78_04155 [Chlamydiia bacterium]|nr:hypothetical protein [Chlamydiia bacterium]
MRIFAGFRGARGDYPLKREGVDSLQRSEIIADIFNNEAEKGDKDRAVRVRISNMTRALIADLDGELRGVLSKHPDLAEKIEDIALPDGDWLESKRHPNLTVRKVGAYLRWRQMQGDAEGVGEGDASFAAVRALGKDDELIAVYQRNLEKHQELRQLKGRSVPNYYYILYPETYSFN